MTGTQVIEKREVVVRGRSGLGKTGYGTLPEAVREQRDKEEKEGITTKQRELLRKVVKGFDIDDVIALLLEEHGLNEVRKAIRA